MSESQENNPYYLDRHPDAIQDAELAHDMANAGNRSRSIAASKRKAAKLAFELSLKEGESSKNFNDMYDSTLQTLDEDPENKGAQERYKALTEINSSHDLEDSIDKLKKSAQENDARANVRESSVSSDSRIAKK